MSTRNAYEALLECEAQKYPSIVRDGIVEYETFDQQPIRILWILKETNDSKGSCTDLREFLKNPTCYPKWKRTWLPVLQVSLGILSIVHGKEEDFEIVKSKIETNPSYYLQMFKKIAAINVNKFSGNEKITPKKLKESYKRFGGMVKSQFKLIKPDITICCGVFWLMWENRNQFKIELDEPDYEYAVLNKEVPKVKAHYNSYRLFVETLHPNQRKMTRKLYYGSIIGTVAWWLKTAGRNNS